MFIYEDDAVINDKDVITECEDGVSSGSTERYNDELISWIQFNSRVLNEAKRKSNPIIERFLFMGIADSNLDEFIRTKFKSTRGSLRKLINQQTRDLEQAYDETVIELREKYKINIITASSARETKSKVFAKIKEYFDENIFPTIQPLVLKDELPLPDIEDGGTFLVTKLEDATGRSLTGIIRLPDQKLIKFNDNTYVVLDSIIELFVSKFYKGYKIVSNKFFRVFRKIDSLAATDSSNYLNMIKKELMERETAEIIMVDIESSIVGIEAIVGGAKKRKRKYPHGLSYLKSIKNIISYTDDMVYEKAKPRIPIEFIGESVFDIITRNDVLVHFPYQSFEMSTLRLLNEAARDPDVVSIKQTLYRVSKDSPLTKALINAAKAGKQVVVLLELKAKMDEYNNLLITESMSAAGINVIFGPVQMKTHAKVTLIIRKEGDKIAKYANISTGNFNDETAKVYEDLSYFCKERKKYRIGDDLCELFNHLGAYSHISKIRNLLVAPYNFRETISEEVDRCIKAKITKPTVDVEIIIKCNAFTDRKMADKVYEASKAGCKVYLIVRGMCIVKPGVPEMSENVEVISVVGRYLEHSRIYQFKIKDEEKEDIQSYMGSGDIMPRNLDYRIEVVIPLKNAGVKKQIAEILNTYLQDNTNAYKALPDGTYSTPISGDDINKEGSFSVQNTWIKYYKKQEKDILR